ncbi:MAG: beta-lactamase family protein [Planctomycetota bacterium]|nr:beta-lactamase family protein [Planctomycetota bacterium]
MTIPQPPRIPSIDQSMQSYIDKHEISGAVTLVADKDKILHLSAVGLQDIEHNIPMRADSIFWVASMTKLMTATSVMMLEEEGKLSIDDPVAKYIPAFANLKTHSGKPANLTLRHLITHTSGLAEAPPEKTKVAKTLGELEDAYLDRPTAFEPGTKWKYCQSGINTLGHIIEIASGQSYADYVTTHLIQPLGMTDASYYPSAQQAARLAISYSIKEGALHAVAIRSLDGHLPTDTNRYAAANAGLFCTASDYVRLCQMLLNNGTFQGHEYLKPETVKMMTSNQTDDIPNVGFIPGSNWGLGFGIVAKPEGVTAMLSPGTFGHSGVYGTQAWTDPVKGRIYILLLQRGDLKNSEGSSLRGDFQQAAVDALAN